ncbi:MAG: M56 family metallopeptidase [Bacteroidota bacterium]
MTMINWLDLIPAGHALGWTLLHSCWQVTIIALIVRFLLFWIPSSRSKIRYNLLVGSMLIVLIWSGRTLQQELAYANHPTVANSIQSKANNDHSPLSSVIAKEAIQKPGSNHQSETDPAPKVFTWQERLHRYLIKIQAYLPALTIMWMIGVCFFSLMMIIGFKHLNQLKRQGIESVDVHWQQRFQELQQRMGIFKEVQFQGSNRIMEPITFHYFKPVVLVPISIFTGLSDEQVEVLLLHELAHIRRHDFLVNIFQGIVEILFFFHPAVWWISAKARTEREHCCDDLVLKVKNQPMVYAEALTWLQLFNHPLKTKLAMSAKGKKTDFSQRIYRLFGTPNKQTPWRGSAVFVLLILIAISVQAFVSVPHNFQSGQVEPTTAEIAESPSTENIDSNQEMEKTTQNEEASLSLLFDAIQDGNLEVVQLLIQQGVDINGSIKAGRTPLIESARTSQLRILKYLIKKGAKVNQEADNGFTALMEAAYRGSLEAVTFLYQNGANIKKQDKEGNNALMIASKKGYTEIAAFLIEKGSSFKAETNANRKTLQQPEEISLPSKTIDNKPIGRLPEVVRYNNISVSKEEGMDIRLGFSGEARTKVWIEDLIGSTQVRLFEGTFGSGNHGVGHHMKDLDADQTYWLIIQVKSKQLKQKIGAGTALTWN